MSVAIGRVVCVSARTLTRMTLLPLGLGERLVQTLHVPPVHACSSFRAFPARFLHRSLAPRYMFTPLRPSMTFVDRVENAPSPFSTRDQFLNTGRCRMAVTSQEGQLVLVLRQERTIPPAVVPAAQLLQLTRWADQSLGPGVTTIEAILARSDEGSVLWRDYEGTDHVVYRFFRSYFGDTRLGAVFRGDDSELLVEEADGDITASASSTQHVAEALEVALRVEDLE